MTDIVIDPQALGWRDDGTESGLVRVSTVRGNVVQMPFIPVTYSVVPQGAAALAFFTTPRPAVNADGTGTYLAVTVQASATFANSLVVRFWITGNVFGLRYSPTTNPIGCMIDGVAYAVPSKQNIDPVSGLSPGSTIASTVEGVILANDLGEGRHFVELSFPAFASGATRTYEILGYLVDAAAGYITPPANVVSIQANTLAITATTGATAQRLSGASLVFGGWRGWRKVLFYNTTGGALTINMVYSTATSTVVWSKSIPAGDTLEFDPQGVIVDTTNLLFYASGAGINATPILSV